METINILTATVGHQRLHPKKHRFAYRVFYLAHPVASGTPKTPSLFSYNHFNLFSVRAHDHGPHDGSPWRPWVARTLHERNITLRDTDTVTLIAHPRLFGYAFNPISYWLVHRENALIAAICEVRNTFKDTHNYTLAHDDGRTIVPEDVFTAEKHLYVSPLNSMNGHYEFTFTATDKEFKSVINYFQDDIHTMNTYMGGTYQPLTNMRILSACVHHPLMTLLVIVRIHWQALKTRIKGVRHTLNEKPDATRDKTTHGDSVSK